MFVGQPEWWRFKNKSDKSCHLLNTPYVPETGRGEWDRHCLVPRGRLQPADQGTWKLINTCIYLEMYTCYRGVQGAPRALTQRTWHRLGIQVFTFEPIYESWLSATQGSMVPLKQNTAGSKALGHIWKTERRVVLRDVAWLVRVLETLFWPCCEEWIGERQEWRPVREGLETAWVSLLSLL